ncbi:MAG: peptide deformylase, partial [Candidatus Omnitrophica bacterium]|nr:peptide deformylase [Candidatus Omnitrophota bacterium]
QHEIDHLNGVLFIDRLEDREKEKIQPELDRFEAPVSA